MRRLHGARRARRTRRRRDTLEIKRNESGIRVDPGNGYIDIVREPLRSDGRTIQNQIRHAASKLLQEDLLQRALPPLFLLHVPDCRLRGRRKARRCRDILRPCPPSPLLHAAVQKCAEPDSPTDIQKADALGSADFVGARTHQINPVPPHIDRDFSIGLNGIRVKQNLSLFRIMDAPRNLTDRFDRADLVVCHHHRDKRGLWRDPATDRFLIDAASLIHIREHGLRPPAALQIGKRMQNRVMLNRCGDNLRPNLRTRPEPDLI